MTEKSGREEEREEGGRQSEGGREGAIERESKEGEREVMRTRDENIQG